MCVCLFVCVLVFPFKFNAGRKTIQIDSILHVSPKIYIQHTSTSYVLHASPNISNVIRKPETNFKLCIS